LCDWFYLCQVHSLCHLHLPGIPLPAFSLQVPGVPPLPACLSSHHTSPHLCCPHTYSPVPLTGTSLLPPRFSGRPGRICLTSLHCLSQVCYTRSHSLCLILQALSFCTLPLCDGEISPLCLTLPLPLWEVPASPHGGSLGGCFSLSSTSLISPLPSQITSHLTSHLCLLP